VGHSGPPSATTRLRLVFAIAQAVLVIAGCLALTAGAAAGSGVNLGSVARDLVAVLDEPLALLHEVQQDAIGVELEDRLFEELSNNLVTTGQSVDEGLDDRGAHAVSDSSNDAKPPAQEGLPNEVDPLEGSPPANAGTHGAPVGTPVPSPVPATAPPNESPQDKSPNNGNHAPANGNHPPANGNHPPANGDHPPANGDHPPANGDHPPATGDHGHPPAIHPPGAKHRGTQPADQPETARQPAQNPGPNGGASNHSTCAPSNGQDGPPNEGGAK